MLKPSESEIDRIETSYPTALRALEYGAIFLRRKQAKAGADIPPDYIPEHRRAALSSDLGVLDQDMEQPPPEGTWIPGGIGLAISGGGIRSAIFGLGVLQAMATSRFLRLIDFLSTVSGGSYIGSYLGRHYLRQCEFAHPPGRDAARAYPPGAPIAMVTEDIVANSHSSSVYWLRENGRYLAPGGGGDALVAVTAGLRDWLSLQVFLLVFVLAFFCGARTLQALCDSPRAGVCQAYVEIHPVTFHGPHHPPHDPFPCFLGFRAVRIAGLPLVVLAGTCLGLCGLYWLAEYLLYLWYVACKSREAETSKAKMRRDLTELTAYCVLLLVLTALYRFIDLSGRALFFQAGPSMASAYAGAVAVIATGTRVWTASKVFRREKSEQEISWLPYLAGAAGIVLLLAYLIGLSALSYWCVAQHRTMYGAHIHASHAFKWALVLLAVSAFWGRLIHFLNLTSLHALYTARLVRAFLGASNPVRWRVDGQSVTEPIPGDDIPMRQYRPYEYGGPLHIVNTTLNETLSGESQLEQRDRKGLGVAVSPLAISVGVSHHARQDDMDDPLVVRLIALRPPKPAAFVVFPADSVKAEAVTLGGWVGISGAAVSTGMGAYTGLGTSVLLGFLNLRLGYWWNSGISPGRREKRTPLSLSGSLAGCVESAFTTLFPAQSYLLDEFFGRFRGPARRHWNLTDGGHFENTGVYELLRRQLALIICLDNGADPEYQLADLGNLIRRVRIDFDAAVRFLHFAKSGTGKPGLAIKEDIETWLSLYQGTPPDLRDRIEALVNSHEGFFGNIEDFAPGTEQRQNGCHAAIALVQYSVTKRFGVLIWMKPTCTGDESGDIDEYHSGNPAFPQQPTADQFFDEAQWESYRKLGRHIGEEFLKSIDGKIGPLLERVLPQRPVPKPHAGRGRRKTAV